MEASTTTCVDMGQSAAISRTPVLHRPMVRSVAQTHGEIKHTLLCVTLETLTSTCLLRKNVSLKVFHRSYLLCFAFLSLSHLCLQVPQIWVWSQLPRIPPALAQTVTVREAVAVELRPSSAPRRSQRWDSSSRVTGSPRPSCSAQQTSWKTWSCSRTEWEPKRAKTLSEPVRLCRSQPRMSGQTFKHKDTNVHKWYCREQWVL